MPKDSSQSSFPTSSSDFALPTSVASTSALTIEETNFLFQRFRRPSLLAPKAILHSPLQASFTLSPSSKRKAADYDNCLDGSHLYRDRIYSDSSGSSGSENPTPPLAPNNSEEELGTKAVRSKSVSTPPRKYSDADSHVRHARRRLSFPLKQPRIFDIVSSESRPAVEDEVKSEAAFQRLLASGAELPLQPRTPRASSDRGRYPEEAGNESQPEDTQSEDEDDYMPSYSSSVSEPISIPKRHTPTNSVNDDDFNTMSLSESPSFFSSMSMDVDVGLSSPSISSTPINSWRYTPPPTASAIRPNKRKLEDRFDPYPAAKRRAVSPSISYLRDGHSHSSLGSPITRNVPRLPLTIPVPVPASTTPSATSSPTITSPYPSSLTRGVSMAASPTLRSTIGLSSPVLRPLARNGRRDGDEREVDGTGDAVGGLSLGT
ncbi:hypothetical protein E1B28_000852 [Marasmius oreades]|uniref:Uncharacterized protein n=1 Tax=Marasmius oreades TaxID=181124 RepID=A0A9P7V270_9AGAR|nr:uncharacterized protein E1B28_000852 [Marasmius oreades]KAG7098964.1 hypothetical protein E1B28_000852 [Marasmius oreades]